MDPVPYALLLHQPLALSKPTSITTRPNFALPAENSCLIPPHSISTPSKEIRPTPYLVFLLIVTIYKENRGKDSSFSLKIILFTHIVKVMIH